MSIDDELHELQQAHLQEQAVASFGGVARVVAAHYCAMCDAGVPEALAQRCTFAWYADEFLGLEYVLPDGDGD